MRATATAHGYVSKRASILKVANKIDDLMGELRFKLLLESGSQKGDLRKYRGQRIRLTLFKE